MITLYGNVLPLPAPLVAAADRIKHLNYKTTTPKRFQKETLTEEIAGELMERIAIMIGYAKDRLDYVYFSAAKGAEPHTDELDPTRFQSDTFIIPVILPHGKTIIHAGECSVEASLGEIYHFNHEKTHSMTVEDTESGCVVIMVAIKHITENLIANRALNNYQPSM